MFSFSFLRFSMNLKLPSVFFFFKKVGDIISPSILISIISCWALEQLWVLDSKIISACSSIGSPDIVAKISWYEVRDLHIGKQDFVLPPWKSSLCCFKFLLRIHSSSCKISELCCVCCCCNTAPVSLMVD